MHVSTTNMRINFIVKRFVGVDWKNPSAFLAEGCMSSAVFICVCCDNLLKEKSASESSPEKAKMCESRQFARTRALRLHQNRISLCEGLTEVVELTRIFFGSEACSRLEAGLRKIASGEISFPNKNH